MRPSQYLFDSVNPFLAFSLSLTLVCPLPALLYFVCSHFVYHIFNFKLSLCARSKHTKKATTTTTTTVGVRREEPFLFFAAFDFLWFFFASLALLPNAALSSGHSSSSSSSNRAFPAPLEAVKIVR